MDTLNMFTRFLRQERGQKESTIRTNLKMMRKILRLVDPLSHENVERFLKELIVNRAAPSSVKQNVAVLRQWGQCFDIPFLKILQCPKMFYRSSFVRATFSDDEIENFLNLPNPYPRLYKTKGIYHGRYEMWIIFYSILFYHGMRTGEIAKLQVDMFDFGLDLINLPSEITKTARPRSIPMSPAVRDKLYNYVNSLDQAYLFPSLHETTKERGVLHIKENEWNYFFKKQILRLGIKRKNLNPYSGRHTYGTRQAEEGVHLSKIKAIMGHERIQTTEGYIHLGMKSLR
jgi:integrase